MILICTVYTLWNVKPSVQFSSIAQLCLIFCNPVDCSKPGLPVHHQLWSLLKLMSIESVIPSNHLIFCHPLLFLPSIFPSIRVFSNESVLHIRWPKYWSIILYWYVLYWCHHYGKQYGVSSEKLKTELPYDPTIPSLGVYLKKT